MTLQRRKQIVLFGGIPAAVLAISGSHYGIEQMFIAPPVSRYEWALDTARRNDRERHQDLLLTRIDNRVRIIYCAEVPIPQKEACQ